MSYNIDCVKVISSDAYISRSDAVYLQEFEERPEICFIDELGDLLSSDEKVKLTSFDWAGMFSGRSYEPIFLGKIVPMIKGEAELVFIWEGGDSVCGLHIKDGKYTEYDVEYRLIK